MEVRRVASGSLLDGVLQDRISGEVDWQQKSYPLGGDGTHALVWVYSKDSGSESGSDRGWVDYLQWTPSGGGGSSTTDWEQITYTYDPSGRRIAKDVDGVVTRYVTACPELAERDGGHCIAEYDGSNNLLRKYIYGPGIDQPICMIEAAGGYAGTYYYHFDALGSVVALSDGDGDTVQVYEYDVYGQVAASDPNHPNRFVFTGREFDTETGLYYYRARYYNASIGRFLQTDPIGYADGMNWYEYCRNNPVGLVDPSGLIAIAFYDGSDPGQSFHNGQQLVGVANGAQFKEGADDFVINIDLTIPDYLRNVYETSADYMIAVLNILKELGVDVTEIYFLDHGNARGIELRDEYYAGEDLKELAEKLGEVTNDGTKLHFRQCEAGFIADDIAVWSGRETSGLEGPVNWSWCAEYHVGDERPGADWDMTGYKYVIYDPNGKKIFEQVSYQGY